MIQSVMLALLGFFIAAFAVLLLAPAYWRRAVRLTTQHLKRTMPMTTAEIRADKDRIRAESAIKIHRLHKRAEQSKLNEARQLIELNRRDARIHDLEGDVRTYKGDLTENQNARRVMEQTINFRLPQIESRLLESKRLLAARDREMIHFVKSAQRHDELLHEAKAYHEQQRQEIERLRAALTLQTSRDRGRVRDPGFGAEMALRSEMEALRSRNRDQTTLIERLQTELVRFRSNGAEASEWIKDDAPDAMALAKRNRILADEVEALKLKLQGHEDEKMGVAPGLAADGRGGREVDAQLLQNEVKKLREKTTAQADEIDSLSAELKAMGTGAQDSGKPVVRLTKRVLNAKIGALEKRTDRQAETIARLRTELAASNERAARQAASYMKEMRQIGLGPLSQPYEVHAKDGAVANGRSAAAQSRSIDRKNINRNGLRGPQSGAASPAMARAESAGNQIAAPPANKEDGTIVAHEVANVVANETSEGGDTGRSDEGRKPAPVKASNVVENSKSMRKRLIDRISRRD